MYFMVHCFGPPSLSLCVHESAFMWFTLPGYMSFLMLMSMFVEHLINYADWSFVCVNMWLLFQATSSPTNVGVGADNLTSKGVLGLYN